VVRPANKPLGIPLVLTTPSRMAIVCGGQPMRKHDDDSATDEHGDPIDDPQPKLGERFTDYVPSVIHAGPDGAPLPFVGEAPSIPPRSADNWVCLRGPCRHYMHIVGTAAIGNPRGTFEEGKEPRQLYDWCLVFNGEPLDMEDDAIFACSHWDPQDPDDVEVMQRERRRSKFLKLYPQYIPTPADDIQSDVDDVVNEMSDDLDPPPAHDAVTGVTLISTTGPTKPAQEIP
jgi:hypothetical protein